MHLINICFASSADTSLVLPTVLLVCVCMCLVYVKF